MPILDLQTSEYGFPEAGRIRLGLKKVNKNGVEYPVEADYFVMSDAQDLIPHYGQTPKELLVFLPYQERDRNFRAYYELFKTGGLYCQGDGENITWAIDPGTSGNTVIRDGRVTIPYKEDDNSLREIGTTVPCSGKSRIDNPLYPRCAKCKARALLFVLVRDPKDPLRLVNNRLAYYRLSTGSIHNIIGLTESLNTFGYLAAGMKKGLAGIPLILRRVERTMAISTKSKENPDISTRSQVTKQFLAFEADPKWAEIAALAMAASALNTSVDSMLTLPDGSHEFDADDVIDGDGLYVPEETQEIDERLANQIADLHAMKDEMPTDWKAMHMILEQFHPGTYSTTDTLVDIRKRLGIRRTDKLQLDKATWSAALDSVIETLGGGG